MQTHSKHFEKKTHTFNILFIETNVYNRDLIMDVYHDIFAAYAEIFSSISAFQILSNCICLYILLSETESVIHYFETLITEFLFPFCSFSIFASFTN